LSRQAGSTLYDTTADALLARFFTSIWEKVFPLDTPRPRTQPANIRKEAIRAGFFYFGARVILSEKIKINSAVATKLLFSKLYYIFSLDSGRLLCAMPHTRIGYCVMRNKFNFCEGSLL